MTARADLAETITFRSTISLTETTLKPLGLLLMAYGTPHHDEIASYYTHIRGGQPPSASQLARLQGRYQAIGGQSPLEKITRKQAAKLSKALGERLPGYRITPYVGFKHSAPFIEDAITAARTDGMRTLLAVIMTPHQCAGSTQAYRDRATAAARAGARIDLRWLANWHRDPGFIKLWAERIHNALAPLSNDERQHTLVVFSAHSLPSSMAEHEIYARQVHESARLITTAAGLRHTIVAWQSAGHTGQTWLGPDIRTVVREQWDRGFYQGFLVCPIGFVADHLEVLYDDDIDCRAVVEGLGGHYLRPSMPNADDEFISCLVKALTDELVCEGASLAVNA